LPVTCSTYLLVHDPLRLRRRTWPSARAQEDCRTRKISLYTTGDFYSDLHIGLGFSKNTNELSGLLRVVGSEVGVRHTGVTGSTSSTDSVDVVFTVVGEVVVDDVLDVLDICSWRRLEWLHYDIVGVKVC
jgi:hypothetical protein